MYLLGENISHWSTTEFQCIANYIDYFSVSIQVSGKNINKYTEIHIISVTNFSTSFLPFWNQTIKQLQQKYNQKQTGPSTDLNS